MYFALIHICSEGLCPSQIFRFIRLKQWYKYNDTFNYDTYNYGRVKWLLAPVSFI